MRLTAAQAVRLINREASQAERRRFESGHPLDCSLQREHLRSSQYREVDCIFRAWDSSVQNSRPISPIGPRSRTAWTCPAIGWVRRRWAAGAPSRSAGRSADLHRCLHGGLPQGLGRASVQARGLISCSTCRPRPPARRSQFRASRMARAEASRSPCVAATRACSLRVAAWSRRRWRALGSDSGETLDLARSGVSNVKVTGADGLETIMAGEDVAVSKTFTTGQLTSNSPIRFGILLHNIWSRANRRHLAQKRDDLGGFEWCPSQRRDLGSDQVPGSS